MASAAVEVLVFFVILLVGYIYVWGTGALDWVRTVDSAATEAGRSVRDVDRVPRDAVLSA